MEAIRRLGISYGKLGISTDPELISRRAKGVEAAAGALESPGVAPLLRAAFGIGAGDERFAFLSAFAADPTFDVQASDQEALLLAGAVAEFEIESETSLSPDLALAVVTCSCGGLRVPPLSDQLVGVAQASLARFQGQRMARPKDRTAPKQPETLTSAIQSISQNPVSYGGAAPNFVVAALTEVIKYAGQVATASATSDQELLAYMGALEQDMSVYWWVTGGRSDDAKNAFARLHPALAAVCAGKELAGKHGARLGLFAAPALIDLLLERGRSEPAGDVSLADAVAVTNRNWRKQVFGAAAAGPLAALLPVASALGLAAASDDADDWKPRFTRLTGLQPGATLPAAELGTQVYRELLLARALG